MKEYQTEDIRNFALVGHGACGKTMLSESFLVTAGALNRLGSIAAGSTVSDYHTGEKERQISIHATPLHLEWLEKKFNFIDTPGYLDFIGETLSSLVVADFALVVVGVTAGVEVGTEQVWNYASKLNLPKLLVLNGADKEHVGFEGALQDLRDHFGQKVFPLMLPVNPGPGFNQVVDVLRKKILTYSADGDGTFTESDLTGDWVTRVEKLHEELIEYVAESDDALLEKFFEQEGLTEEEMRGGIHAAVQNQAFIPVFCTSAVRNLGVSRLMDFIAKYGSSPVDRATVMAENPRDGKEVPVNLSGKEPVVFIFKTLSEAHVGELSLFRVYSGKVSTGQDLYNVSRDKSERLGQLFVLNGKTRTSVNFLNAGDIGAVVKLKDTHTGDTLCHPKFTVELAGIDYPEPNIHAAISIHSKGDEEKVAVGLATLHEEDPTFKYRVDAELKQTVISGQGELHLQVVSQRLKRRYNVEIDLKEPKIPYRETIQAKGESKYRHKKQSGGAGQFAEVWMRIEPKERGSGVEFTESLVGQNVDRVFVPSVEKGVKAACEEGVIAGYRVVDLKVEFYDGKQHPVDSKDIAFQIAGKEAFKEAFRAAKPCLLEPIINLEVKVPEDYMGDVMGDISGRRGKILGMDTEGSFQVIKAQVPQANLYNYSTTLRSLTGGRGLHSESFSHYEQMPRDLEQRVIEKSKKKDEE